MGRPDVWEPGSVAGRFLDGHGRPISMGERVTVDGHFGTVVGLSDPDGEVDDGRRVYFPPALTVRFDDGDEERLLFEHSYDCAYRCEDAAVLVASRLFEFMADLSRAVDGVWAR